METVAIILAAGQGKRMGAGVNKQYLKLQGKPILAQTLLVFDQCAMIDGIIVVTHVNEIEYCQEEVIKPYGLRKVTSIVAGGKERQDSVYCGLKALPIECKTVVVHDGARPLITSAVIEHGLKTLDKQGVVVGVPTKDTIKRVDEQGIVVETPKRSALWSVQTPQIFDKNMIVSSYIKAMSEGFVGTDDASMVEYCGGQIKMVMGDYENIKITTPEDLPLAEAILASRKARP